MPFQLSAARANNQTSLGICAMDYVGDDPSPNPDTPGIVVDDVSFVVEKQHICLPIVLEFLRPSMTSW